MSAGPEERREARGIVADALRRPIEDAVREAVKEALEEQGALAPERATTATEEDEGGRPWGRYALLVAVGLGLSVYVLFRRRRHRESERYEATGSVEPSFETVDAEEQAAPSSTTAGDDEMD